jgi:DNA-binding beta-propeller fold protein YncE
VPKISVRSFLKALLVILIVLVVALLYLLYVLMRPPGKAPLVTRELKPLFSIYGYGTKPEEQLYRPHDIAFDKQGNIYITDTGHARILVFDGRGRFLFKFGKKGTGKGELYTPMGIAIAPNGNIYVADKDLSKVAIFSPEGKFIKDFMVMMPIKPFIANNKLYLTTYGPFYIFDLNGKQLAKWGKRGRGEGEFDYANGVAVDSNGHIYISDLNNLRLQAFNKKGDIVWIKGKPPEDIFARKRAFGLPAGLAMDEKGFLYLVDAFHHQIKVLTKKGKQIAALGRKGNRDGEFYYPAGIAYGGRGRFAIADKYNDRVQVVRITIR